MSPLEYKAAQPFTKFYTRDSLQYRFYGNGFSFGGGGNDVESALSLVRGSSGLQEQCPKNTEHIRCLGTRYRSLDGICNNVEEPWWGASWHPLRRLLPAEYSDGS